MALNFPDSPTLNQVYTDTTAGFSYQWDGSAWQSYTPTAVKNILIVDDISGSFNGSTDTFSLTSDGSALIPANAQQLRVTLGGIVQRPTIDYTVSGSDITFTTPPSSPLSCNIVSLGPAVPVNTIDDGSITPSKLSTGGPSWNTDGDVVISGILTVGTSTLTLNGDTNQINGVTISSGIVTATSLYADSATISGNVSIAGTLTYEDVTNVDSIGLITARSGIEFGISGAGGSVTSNGDAVFSGIVTATGGFNLGISSAGSVITSGPIKTLNFVGTGNTFAVDGTTVDISIQGGGGSGGLNPVSYFLD